MIVTQEDIADFRAELTRYEADTRWQVALHRALAEHGPDNAGAVARQVIKDLDADSLASIGSRTEPNDILGYFTRKPHLLIPSGFDEIRIRPEPAAELLDALEKEGEKRFPGFTLEGSEVIQAALPSLQLLLGLECRQGSSGTWFSSSGFQFAEQELVLRAPTHDSELRLSLRGILESCERAIAGSEHPAVLLLPNLWVPPATYPSLELAETAKATLLAIQRETISLEDLSWQQLEDVVAELLRSRGMQILVTPRSKDGGRDIIAKGELIPGEPTTLAVEVKHREKVGLDDLRSRLWANREFPMVMLATSGQFTAGVIKEKNRPENFMRLLLKDGQALSSWIHLYNPDTGG